MSRQLILQIRWCAVIFLCAGCARVAPQGDVTKARDLMKERTGEESTYDPAADEIVDQKVEGLLTDGVTVDEAVQIALLRNRGFQSLFAKIGASRADVVQSTLLSNPSFGFAARFPEGGGRSNLTFNFAQELVDLWQIPVRKKIAEAQLEQTIFQVVQRGVDLVADTRIKCYQLLALQRSELIAQENVALVEKSLKLARDRNNAGEVGQIDVNLIRATLLEVRLSLIAVQRDLQIAKTALAREMGLARWESQWELKDALQMSATALTDDHAMLIHALNERFDARIAASAVREAESDLRRQYLNIFPNVTAGAELERSERRALPGRKILADTARSSVRSGTLTAPDIQTRSQRSFEKRQIIDSILGPTIQITVPIWDQNQAQIAKGLYKVEQRRKEFEDLLDTVAQQIFQAAASARTAVQLVHFFDEQTLPQATENLNLAQRAYQAGEQNIVALIDAQRFLITQRLAHINVIRDYAVAMAELQRASGGRVAATATSRPVDH